MGSKINDIEESGADGKEFSRCHIVLRLQNDQEWTVFVHEAARFGPRGPADVGMPFGVILIEIIQLRHQLPAADGTVRRVKRHSHVPWAGIARTCAAGIKDGMRNGVLEQQSAKRMAQEHAMMIGLIRRSSC